MLRNPDLSKEQLRNAFPLSGGLLYISVFAVGFVPAVLLGLFLAWDGSYIMFRVLWSEGPFVPHDKLINIPLQLPGVISSFVTGDRVVLQAMFGASYAAVPVLSLGASWWITRKTAPHLFVWPALGIAVLSLPGQAFFVSEALMSVQMAWPILMVILLRLNPRHAPLVAVTIVALLVSHPFAIPILGLAAAACFVVGLRFAEDRRRTWRWAAIFVAVTVGAAFRFVVAGDPYEAGSLAPDVLGRQFQASVSGLPFVSVILVYLCGITLLVSRVPWLKGPGQFHAGLMAGAAALVAGSLLVLGWWASDPAAWQGALDYRGWVLFISLPVMALATVEALSDGTNTPPAAIASIWRSRRLAVSFTAIAPLLVLSAQGLSWQGVTHRLEIDLANTPRVCVSAASIPWVRDSPLDHWSVAETSLVLQGREAGQIILDNDFCETADFAAGIPFGRSSSFPPFWDVPSGDDGWFDTELLVTLLTLERAETATGFSSSGE